MAPLERSAYIKANPSNFIKTMRTPEDYFELEKPSLGIVLDHNFNEVQKMLEDSSFEIQQQEALYIYRLHTRDHVQTAVIAEVPVTIGKVAFTGMSIRGLNMKIDSRNTYSMLV